VTSQDPREQLVLEQQQGGHINRIGNLTLVTGPLSVSMSNNSWEAKRHGLRKHTKLELNRLLIAEDT
jgi:hypothetical protein